MIREKGTFTMTLSTHTDTATTALQDKTVTLTQDEFACLWDEVTQRRTSANHKYMDARKRLDDSRDVAGLIPLYLREVPMDQARQSFRRWDPIYQKLKAVAKAKKHTVTLSSSECDHLHTMVEYDLASYLLRDLSLRSRYSLDDEDKVAAVTKHAQMKTFLDTLLQKLQVQR